MDEEDKTKEDLIETYREINVDHDWWEYIYEDFKEDMEKNYGIEVDDMSFSGFWSQGSGAAFTGRVTDDRLFMTSNKLDGEYPNIFKAVELNAVNINFAEASRRGSCQTSGVEVDDLHYFDIVEDPEMNEFYQNMFEGGIEEEYTGFEDEVQRLADSWAHELYKTLESNYDWLISDERVWDTIVANELHL